MAAFYSENFIYFAQGPRQQADGSLVLALPLGGAGGKLPGIAAEDIGRCAYGIFRRGPEVAGQRFGIAGDVLSGPKYTAAFARHLGVPVSFSTYHSTITGRSASRARTTWATCSSTMPSSAKSSARNRSPEVARALNPALPSFDVWLGANASASRSAEAQRSASRGWRDVGRAARAQPRRSHDGGCDMNDALSEGRS